MYKQAADSIGKWKDTLILHTLETLAFKKGRNEDYSCLPQCEKQIKHEVYTVPTYLLRPWYATSSTDQSPTLSKIQPFFQ